jgi:hypothetical protein
MIQSPSVTSYFGTKSSVFGKTYAEFVEQAGLQNVPYYYAENVVAWYERRKKKKKRKIRYYYNRGYIIIIYYLRCHYLIFITYIIILFLLHILLFYLYYIYSFSLHIYFSYIHNLFRTINTISSIINRTPSVTPEVPTSLTAVASTNITSSYPNQTFAFVSPVSLLSKSCKDNLERLFANADIEGRVYETLAEVKEEKKETKKEEKKEGKKDEKKEDKKDEKKPSEQKNRVSKCHEIWKHPLDYDLEAKNLWWYFPLGMYLKVFVRGWDEKTAGIGKGWDEENEKIK